MAFVPEDGTGLPDANSYVDVAFADSYFADRGVTDWAGEDTAKQNWLIRATDYIDSRFGGSFKGEQIAEGVQALEFPRYLDPCSPTTPPVALPANLKKACCEYALRAKSTPLAPDIQMDPSGFQVSKTHKKIGPIENDVEYATRGSGAQRELLTPYPAADMLLRGLLKPYGARVIRN
jgi:hypothetical protein